MSDVESFSSSTTLQITLSPAVNIYVLFFFLFYFILFYLIYLFFEAKQVP